MRLRAVDSPVAPSQSWTEAQAYRKEHVCRKVESTSMSIRCMAGRKKKQKQKKHSRFRAQFLCQFFKLGEASLPEIGLMNEVREPPTEPAELCFHFVWRKR